METLCPEHPSPLPGDPTQHHLRKQAFISSVSEISFGVFAILVPDLKQGELRILFTLCYLQRSTYGPCAAASLQATGYQNLLLMSRNYPSTCISTTKPATGATSYRKWNQSTMRLSSNPTPLSTRSLSSRSMLWRYQTAPGSQGLNFGLSPRIYGTSVARQRMLTP